MAHIILFYVSCVCSSLQFVSVNCNSLCLFVSLVYVCLFSYSLCLYFIKFVTVIFIVTIQTACCKVNNAPVGAEGSLGIQE